MKKGIEYQPVVGDFGHSNAKVISKDTELIFPSLISEGPLMHNVNGIFASTTSRKSVDNIAIETPFGIRYVGNIAKQSQRLPWTVFGEAKYDHPEFIQTILLASLSEAKLTGEQICLVTAMPGEWYQNKAIRKQLIAKLKGSHTIKRVGKRDSKTVVVSDVIVLSETGGLFYSYLLNSGGGVAVDEPQNLRTIAIDIGEYTICVDMFEGLRRVGQTQSFTDVSMGEIHSSIVRDVASETGRHLETYQVQDIIIDVDVAVPRAIKTLVLDLYKKYIINESNMFLSIASAAIQNINNVDVVLVGGGGSKAFSNILFEAYPRDKNKFKILGQFATAQGLYNYGVRLCQENLK